MFFIFLILGLLELTHTGSVFNNIKADWKEYKLQHMKTYDNKSLENQDFQNYLDNWMFTRIHNTQYDVGLRPYRVKLNRFAHVHQRKRFENLKQINTTGASKRDSRTESRPAKFIRPKNLVLPDHVNWTAEGAVTPVRDQGDCEASWAFAAAGALESQQYRLDPTHLMPASPQNLIDCTRAYGNKGCIGGDIRQCYNYVRDNEGIDAEEAYPYEAFDNDCRYDDDDVVAIAAGYVEIEAGDEQALMEAVAAIGPISASITIDCGFVYYQTGVYEGHPCTEADNPIHGVLVVGYGTDNITGHNYWLVKNSWGVDWGEQGYIRIIRNINSNCIAQRASYPLMY